MKAYAILLFSAIFSTLSCQNSSLEDTQLPPNIILIFVDDMGYSDIGCYGSQTETPNLDQLAREGAKLTNFHVAQPVCSASRAALLTGCYSNRIGIHQALMPDSKVGLNTDETTLAELLKKQGYSTALFGKWHLGDKPEFMPNNHGFDEFFGIPYSNDMWPLHPWQGSVFNFPDLPLYENKLIIDTLTDQSNLTRTITEKAVSFIRRKKNRPFFLYIPHPQPHVPLFVSKTFEGKSGRGLYADVTMELDWSVGEMMNTLKEEGLEKNTIVIFTSDNGPWLSYGEHSGSTGIFREGKGTNFEGGIRVPFIIKYPPQIPANSSIETPLVSIDILPSLVHVTQSKMPEKYVDGRNAWEVFTGEKKASPQDAYFFYYRVNELQAVLSGKWKLVLPQKYRSLNGRAGGKNGLPIEYEQLTVENPELYNLELDPSESLDIAKDNPDVTRRLLILADSMNTHIGPKGIDHRKPGLLVTAD